MTEPALPRGCTLIDKRTHFTVRCDCDWTAYDDTSDKAVAKAVDHARSSAWCYIHRNLTPIGAEPTMGEDER